MVECSTMESREHVGKWIGHWTQDQKIWGRFPVLVGQICILFRTALVHPAVMGSWCIDQ